jgi:hypothetical protein
MDITRLKDFYGGNTVNERDRRLGVAYNLEDVDIFSSPAYMQANTIWATDIFSSPLTSITRSGSTATATSTNNHPYITGDTITVSGANQAEYNGVFTVTVTGVATFTYTVTGTPATPATGTLTSSSSIFRRKIRGYDLSEADDLYMLTQSGDGDAEVWKLGTASATAPGAWTFFFESANDVHPNSTPAWHKWASGADYLYYPTISGTTVTLRKLGDLTTASETSIGVLTGLSGSSDRCQMKRAFGELFGLNGNYIFKVGNDGTFTEKAFTLPTDLTAVSMDIRGDLMYILCKYVNAGVNKSRIVVWDLSSTSQPVQLIDIPMGGPQWIVNHQDMLRLLCAKVHLGRIFEIQGGYIPVVTHEILNMQLETAAQSVSPVSCLQIDDKNVHFALYKTDKCGMYALGRTEDGYPLALCLFRRWATTDYQLHTPRAHFIVNFNVYGAFLDNATEKSERLEGNAGPTRSANAVYESIFLDSNAIDIVKDWKGFILTTKPQTNADISLTVDAIVDNGSGYIAGSTFTLTTSNDYTVAGSTENTYWQRFWNSVVGRLLRVRVRWNNASFSSTALPVYSISVLSENRPII